MTTFLTQMNDIIEDAIAPAAALIKRRGPSTEHFGGPSMEHCQLSANLYFLKEEQINI